MKKACGLKIVLASLFLTAPVTAQLFPENEILFEHLLPGRNQDENSITCFLQDRQGFLWIGTKGGLFKYDGYMFQLYKMDPGSAGGLSSSYIRCLQEYASREKLLIGTDGGGLNILDKRTGSITRYMHDAHDSTTIGSNIVYDIKEDKSGRIWVATLGGGLNSFDPDSLTFRKHLLDTLHPDSRANKYLTCLYFDQDQQLFIGTKFSGIYQSDNDLGTYFPLTDRRSRVALQEIWSITEDRSGNLWIGSQFNGICKATQESEYVYSLEKYGRERGFLNKSVITTYCDHQGTIWAGAWAGGLYRYNANEDRFTCFSHSGDNPLSLSGDHVLSIFEDTAGTIWIGTHAKGINLVQPGRWKFHPHTFTKKFQYGSLVNEVRSLLFTEATRTLWLGTTQGLMKIDTRTGAWTRYNERTQTQEGLLHDAVNTICPDKDPHILWLGTPIGITRFNTEQNSFRHYPSNIMDRSAPLNINIFKIFEGRQDRLWIGTSRIGLVRFDPRSDTFRTFTPSPGGSGRVDPWLVRDIIEIGTDTLFLGTSQGVHRFNIRTLQVVPFPADHPLQYLADKNITVLHHDSNNRLWIGTDDYGLLCYKATADTLTQITENDGLGSNTIRGIQEDKNGTLFISTDNGISSYDPATGQFRNFYREDGLHGTEFWNLAFTRNSHGVMFFGGIGGFTSLDPDTIQNNRFIPPVHITDFTIIQNGRQVDKNMLYASHVELSYRMKSFSIGFVALNYINPQNNQYKYKLEGLDSEWQSAENNRDVTYRNIQPGRYTFRVKGSNNDGFWNEKGDSLFIYIRPPLWRTPLFKIVMLALILLLLFTMIRRRFLQLHRESVSRRRYTHNLIRDQEQERKRIASELHDSLGQDLLIIKNRINMMLKKEKSQGKDITHLQQICAIADDTISHIRTISFNLHPYQLEKIGLTDALKSMINKINDVSDITFRYRIQSIDGLLGKEQEINVYRIIQELVNNVIKHSQANSAEIDIHPDTGYMHIWLEDDGIGFDYAKAHAHPLGFGLSGIRERVDILDGELAVSSEVGSGTRTYIKIRLEKD